MSDILVLIHLQEKHDTNNELSRELCKYILKSVRIFISNNLFYF